jgi:hypothetical protein
VFHALTIGFEVVCVSARYRRTTTSIPGTSIPGLVAVFEACLTTIGAIAASSLNRGKLRHD